MDFFKPEDFYLLGNTHGITCEGAAKVANQKLLREGRTVFGFVKHNSLSFTDNMVPTADTHSALLVCIKPLEVCKHPRSDVGEYWWPDPRPQHGPYSGWRCKCGAKVIPATFEEPVP